jgi:hypothetical protein
MPLFLLRGLGRGEKIKISFDITQHTSRIFIFEK